MFHPCFGVSGVILTFLVLLAAYVSFGNASSALDLDETQFSEGKPLILTPYIDEGDIEKARSLSKVGNLPNLANDTQVPSYSGLITVDKQHNSNMFYWFVPAQNNDTKAPFIFWLEGGPATSGLYGFFTMHGPYFLTENLTLLYRPGSWTEEFNLIYVDNPVGAGYSFSDPSGYSVNEKHVADNLYEFLQQFFKVYYEYASNDLYVLGDSYAGNYVPAFALKVHSDGNPAQTTFKGIGVANGIFEVETQMNFSEFFYQIGIVDRHQKAVVDREYQTVVKDIRNGHHREALYRFDDLFHYYTREKNTSYLYKFAGYKYYQNFLQIVKPADQFYFHRYVVLPEFKKALHIENLLYESPSDMVDNLFPTCMRSNRHQLTAVMNNYKVLLFHGQMDLYTPYITMLEFVESLEWKLAEEFRNCHRTVWRLEGGDDDDVAGYIHHVGDFYYALVRNAGHRPSYEQLTFTKDLVSRFIRETL